MGIKVTRIATAGQALAGGSTLDATYSGTDVDVTTGLPLDGLLDVNVPAPDDQDVLTWDAGAGEWIAAPGGTGSGLDVELVTVAAAGATETIDVSTARTWDVTLTDDLTVTLTGAVNGEAWFVTLLLRQDGTGGWDVTWPGSVEWPTGGAPTIDPDPNALTVVTLGTVDGGTVWLGFPTGGGTAAAFTVISPAQITSNTNNWNPTGLATADAIRVSTDDSRDLTGIVAPAAAKVLYLLNVGAEELQLVHDATSTAANRFLCPETSNVTLAEGESAVLVYDLTTARWRVVAFVGGGTGGITVKDEGGALATTATTLDFVGAGVVASGTGATKTITISGASVSEIADIPTAETDTDLVLHPDGAGGVEWGTDATGGGGGTIVRSALTPVTPTDDFDSTLSGWTAVSTGGSFDITKTFAQAIDGSHLWLPFASQAGYIYRSTSNVDQEVIAGGLLTAGVLNDPFFGIAILDTAGDGVGMIYHDSDKSCALISIASGVYTGSPGAQITPRLYGYFIGSGLPFWLRLTRTGNTWDGYASITGAAWEGHVATTISKTITAARACVGVFNFGGATGPEAQIALDWFHIV